MLLPNEGISRTMIMGSKGVRLATERVQGDGLRCERGLDRVVAQPLQVPVHHLAIHRGVVHHQKAQDAHGTGNAPLGPMSQHPSQHPAKKKQRLG